MKKLSLYFTAIAVTLCMVYSSCKKTTHDTNPTPKNSRLLSFTKTTAHQSVTIGTTIYSFGPTVLETYTFSYDNSNRVSKIIYTTNDSAKHNNAKMDNLISTFDYSGSVIKKLVQRPDNSIVEIDSFIENSGGLVTNAYTPTINNEYQYYGKLLVRNTVTAHDSLGSASTTSTITSSKGNFLQLTYNDNLEVHFIGLHPEASTVRAYFVYYKSALAGLVIDTVAIDINSSDKEISPYNRVPMWVMAVDTLHDTAYAFYPGGIWTKEDYTFTGDYNRTGDYLQLQSFIQYGANIYQNANLVSSITNSGYTRKMTYTIDAQSFITQTNMTSLDSVGATISETYKLQYQTY